MNRYFDLTSEGYYKSTQAYGQNYFVDGYGSAWVGEMTLPKLNEGEMVGFVLHKRTNSKISWGNWLRVGVQKANNGTFELYVHMHVDNNTNLQTATTFPISDTSVEGKAFRVMLFNGKLVVALEGKVIHTFTSSTKLNAEKGTVGEVLGLSETGEIYCGLLANKVGIVIKEWKFTDILDTSKKYTVSGTVSVGVQAAADVTAATLTFVNEADASKTYTAKPDAAGKYSVKMPSGDYKVTVSYSKYYEDNTFDCSVLFGNVTADISLRKNKVSAAFEVTEDGYYQCISKNGHNKFQSGYGSAWEAELEVPNLTNNQGVGFVLHKANGTSTVWGNWMRILLRKTDDGSIKLFTQMHVDKAFDVATEIPVSTTDVQGKTLQVVLQNRNILVMLDGVVIAQYDSVATLRADSQDTVGDVFGDMTAVYCGLLADKTGIVITDWSFTNN